MPLFNVYFEGVASATVQVEVNVSELDQGNIDAIAEVVRDVAYRQGVPGLCARCSGWGRADSLSLPDDWEAIGVAYSEGEQFWPAQSSS